MQLKIPYILAPLSKAWYDVRKKRGMPMKKLAIALAVILAILLSLLAGLSLWNHHAIAETEPSLPVIAEGTVPTTPTTSPTETITIPTEPPVTEPAFAPKSVAASDPDNWSIQWSIIENDAVVESFTRNDPISFEDDYFALPGVAGFRSDNHRTDASYGTADITEGTITELRKMNVGFLETVDWIGCGWTGQPLVAQWDEETRAIMNLYDDKKGKEGLTEAIYAKMDGWVHFIDMEDGSYTRDPLFIGRVFKGSGALDPRGYPILYLGAGLQRGDAVQSIFAISLIDGEILYELSGAHELAPRYWYGFDGGPLVDAETDTLIWAGENGLLYTIKLNTLYDKTAGTISMTPDAPVMTAYTHAYHEEGRYVGYEASITAADHYVYLGDSSGMLFCVDINTMELVWAQDILDDINATPAFDRGEDGEGYLYAAPSVDYTRGDMPLCKIDAQTGEILWQHMVDCAKDADIPGGALASPLLGRSGTTMEDLVIFSIGCSPDLWSGQVIAFHKETGQIIWQYETKNYIWSSPVALYTDDGRAYIFQADASGTCYLIDGQTGEVLETLKLGRTVESSPVAFGNHILLGTRSSIHLLEIN